MNDMDKPRNNFEEFDEKVGEKTGLTYVAYCDQAEVMGVINNGALNSLPVDKVVRGFIEMFHLKTNDTPGYEDSSIDTLRRVNGYNACIYDYAYSSNATGKSLNSKWMISMDGNVYQDHSNNGNNDGMFRLSIVHDKKTDECEFSVSRSYQDIVVPEKKHFLHDPAKTISGEPVNFIEIARARDIGDVMEIVSRQIQRKHAPSLSM